MVYPDFLHAVAADLYERHGEGISHLNIIFPSQRARLFFTDALVKQINRPLWQPAYLSIDDLVKKISPLRLIDDYSLLIDLYKLYKKHKQSDETFDNFYFWGEILLNDFDTIDKYLVDAEMLLKNLAAQKTLEGDFTFFSDEQIRYVRSFWSSFDPKGESKLQQQFIEIWNILLPVYTDFKALLRKKNEAYNGMIYRDMAQRLSYGETEGLGNGMYIFIGFNALNECEKVLFRYLMNKKQAEFYWDFDEYYTHNTVQEAGYFIRTNMSEFPAPKTFDIASEFNDQKDISIVSVPSEVLQAKIIPTLLAKIDAPLNRKTVIVLADENLLLPVLYSLPDNVEDVNVTMGFPLKQTAVYSLTELLIRLQRNSKTNEKGSKFYHKDVLSVLNHQYIKLLVGKESEVLKAEINNNNKVHIEQSYFKNSLFLKMVFMPISNYADMTSYLINIFENIATVYLPDNKDDNTLRREYIYHFIKALNQLKKSIDIENMPIGMPVFLSLLRTIFGQLRIPFMGEPIKGLQIMGLLETRTLDFDNLIVLSLNEGVLPQTSNTPSFVPYHLRRGFNMPTIEQQEAIYAYYFYRLLQRAKKIQLVYSSKTDEIRTGEMSRYLLQLKFETGHNIIQQSIDYQLNFNESQPIVIEKTNDVTAILVNSYCGENAQRGLSPSALTSYIKCPLQFYFRYIARLSENEEVQEELAVNIFGNILHKVMEKLYLPYLNKPLTETIILSIYNNNTELYRLLDNAFAKEFYHSDTLPADFNENGKLLITRDVIAKYIKGLLLFDAKNSPFTPVSFEKQLTSMQVIELNGQILNIKLSGYADRIDKYNSVTRIIDYKTGGGKGKEKRMNFKNVESLFSKNPKERNSEVFQTFLYALIYLNSHSDANEVIMPVLYFVRDMYNPNFNASLIDDTSKNIVNDFKPYAQEFYELLNNCLCDLFNPSIPFTQTAHADICTRSCAYRLICGR